MIKNIDIWLQSAQSKLRSEISTSLHPEDSISNDGSVSRVSSHRSKKYVASSSPSKASSSASSRLKASARKAALAVEAATFKRRQAMKMEEFMLQQRKEDSRIEIEVAKADAEERVHSKQDNPASIISSTKVLASTPQEVKKRVDVSDRLTVIFPEESNSLLNPNAPEWQSSERPRPSAHSASVGTESVMHHLNMREANASHVVDEQRLQQQQNERIQALLKQQQQQQS